MSEGVIYSLLLAMAKIEIILQSAKEMYELLQVFKLNYLK